MRKKSFKEVDSERLIVVPRFWGARAGRAGRAGRLGEQG